MNTSLSKLLILFMLSAGQVLGQPIDTVHLSAVNPKLDLFYSGHIAHTSPFANADSVWRVIPHQQKKIYTSSTIGYTKDVYWVAFNLYNDSDTVRNFLLEVDNPQIDLLTLYKTDSQGRLQQKAFTGDKLYFDNRIVNNRNFLFPITILPSETQSFLLKIDKHDSALRMPVYLWDSLAHHHKDYTNNLGFGLFFGMALLCAMYAFLVYVFLQRSIYLWYFLWILYNVIYISTALGLSFQYLYPNVLDLNSYFRVYIEVFGLVIFAKFSQQFLSIPKYFPGLNRLINGILYFLLSLVVISAFAFNYFSKIGTIILPSINILFLACGALIFYAAIRSYFIQKSTAVFFFLAFGALAAGLGATILGEFGLVPNEALGINPVMVGSMVELFIFSIAITYRVKNVYDERNDLSVKIAKQQKELLKAYINGMERERERISQELHDDIGSRLSSLKRFFSKQTTDAEKLQEQIDILCEDVRGMSHQLSPPSLHLTGMPQLLHKLAYDMQHNNLKVHVQQYDWPERLSEPLTHSIYRTVQEALNNIIKHAKATEVDIQLFGYENELVVTIDDNGSGFDINKNTNGIGLQNMKARIESVNGTFDINSSEGHGTNILLRVPLQENVST